MNAIICPECGASNPLENAVCDHCGADLSAVKSVLDNANTHYNEALALAHSGRLDEAIAQLEAALALSSQNPQFHNLLGTLYAQKGLFSEAIRAWEQTLALDPEYEKAYKNIDKAHDMEADFAEEAERRPYVLTAYAAGALAILMFIGAGLATFRLMQKNRMIDSYIEETRIHDQQIASARQEAMEWRTKFEAVNEQFPSGGVTGMMQEFTRMQTEVESRDRMIQQLRDRIERQNQNAQEQIAGLNREKTQLQEQLQQLNSLQAQVRTLNTQIEQNNNQLNQTRAQLEQTQAQLTEARRDLESAQGTARDLRSQHATELESLRARYDADIANLRDQNLQLRDDIARYEREQEDRQYADTLLVEAMRSLEQNRFELAHQSVLSALERNPRNAAAEYIRSNVERILNDPIEQELLRYEAQQRVQQQQEQRIALGRDLLQQANESLRNGLFESAIDQAQRAKALHNMDDRFVRDCNRIISQAQESRTEIRIQILEAQRDIQDNNAARARRTLETILRKAPNNMEARELLAQIAQ